MLSAIPIILAEAFTFQADPRFLFPVIWLVVTVVAVLVECTTSDLVSVWFIPGAVVTMILSYFVPVFWIQAIVFVSVSTVLLILSRTVFKETLSKRQKTLKTGAYALEGMPALVEEDIDNAAEVGAVKVNGQLWTARMEPDSDTAKKGEHVEVVRVAGSKLIVRRRA